MTDAYILDASVLLAWIQSEPGAAVVDPLLADCVICSVNWSEVLQKTLQRGRDSAQAASLLKGVGLTVAPLLEEDAAVAADFWLANPTLTLADRCSLALASRMDLPALMADRAWQSADVKVDVVLIR